MCYLFDDVCFVPYWVSCLLYVLWTLANALCVYIRLQFSWQPSGHATFLEQPVYLRRQFASRPSGYALFFGWTNAFLLCNACYLICYVVYSLSFVNEQDIFNAYQQFCLRFVDCGTLSLVLKFVLFPEIQKFAKKQIETEFDSFLSQHFADLDLALLKMHLFYPETIQGEIDQGEISQAVNLMKVSYADEIMWSEWQRLIVRVKQVEQSICAQKYWTITKVALTVATGCFLPCFLSHIVPGLILYPHLFIGLVVCACLVNVVSAKHFLREGMIAFGVCFFFHAVLFLLILNILQTANHYAYLMYSGMDRWEVIPLEFESRDTTCYFEHLESSLHQKLIALSWL